METTRVHEDNNNDKIHVRPYTENNGLEQIHSQSLSSSDILAIKIILV